MIDIHNWEQLSINQSKTILNSKRISHEKTNPYDFHLCRQMSFCSRHLTTRSLENPSSINCLCELLLLRRSFFIHHQFRFRLIN